MLQSKIHTMLHRDVDGQKVDQQQQRRAAIIVAPPSRNKEDPMGSLRSALDRRRSASAFGGGGGGGSSGTSSDPEQSGSGSSSSGGKYAPVPGGMFRKASTLNGPLQIHPPPPSAQLQPHPHVPSPAQLASAAAALKRQPISSSSSSSSSAQTQPLLQYYQQQAQPHQQQQQQQQQQPQSRVEPHPSPSQKEQQQQQPAGRQQRREEYKNEEQRNAASSSSSYSSYSTSSAAAAAASAASTAASPSPASAVPSLSPSPSPSAAATTSSTESPAPRLKIRPQIRPWKKTKETSQDAMSNLALLASRYRAGLGGLNAEHIRSYRSPNGGGPMGLGMNMGMGLGGGSSGSGGDMSEGTLTSSGPASNATSDKEEMDIGSEEETVGGGGGSSHTHSGGGGGKEKRSTVERIEESLRRKSNKFSQLSNRLRDMVSANFGKNAPGKDGQGKGSSAAASNHPLLDSSPHNTNTTTAAARDRERDLHSLPDGSSLWSSRPPTISPHTSARSSPRSSPRTSVLRKDSGGEPTSSKVILEEMQAGGGLESATLRMQLAGLEPMGAPKRYSPKSGTVNSNNSVGEAGGSAASPSEPHSPLFLRSPLHSRPSTLVSSTSSGSSPPPPAPLHSSHGSSSYRDRSDSSTPLFLRKMSDRRDRFDSMGGGSASSGPAPSPASSAAAASSSLLSPAATAVSVSSPSAHASTLLLDGGTRWTQELAGLRQHVNQHSNDLEMQIAEIESALSSADIGSMKARLEALEEAQKSKKLDVEVRLMRVEAEIQSMKQMQRENLKNIYDVLNAQSQNPLPLRRAASSSVGHRLTNLFYVLLTWFGLGIATISQPLQAAYPYIASLGCCRRAKKAGEEAVMVGTAGLMATSAEQTMGGGMEGVGGTTGTATVPSTVATTSSFLPFSLHVDRERERDRDRYPSRLSAGSGPSSTTHKLERPSSSSSAATGYAYRTGAVADLFERGGVGMRAERMNGPSNPAPGRPVYRRGPPSLPRTSSLNSVPALRERAEEDASDLVEEGGFAAPSSLAPRLYPTAAETGALLDGEAEFDDDEEEEDEEDDEDEVFLDGEEDTNEWTGEQITPYAGSHAQVEGEEMDEQEMAAEEEELDTPRPPAPSSADFNRHQLQAQSVAAADLDEPDSASEHERDSLHSSTDLHQSARHAHLHSRPNSSSRQTRGRETYEEERHNRHTAAAATASTSLWAPRSLTSSHSASPSAAAASASSRSSPAVSAPPSAVRHSSRGPTPRSTPHAQAPVKSAMAQLRMASKRLKQQERRGAS